MGHAVANVAIWAFFVGAGLFSVAVVVGSIQDLFFGLEPFLARVRAWRATDKTAVTVKSSGPFYRTYRPNQARIDRKKIDVHSGSSGFAPPGRKAKHRKAG